MCSVWAESWRAGELKTLGAALAKPHRKYVNHNKRRARLTSAESRLRRYSVYRYGRGYGSALVSASDSAPANRKLKISARLHIKNFFALHIFLPFSFLFIFLLLPFLSFLSLFRFFFVRLVCGAGSAVAGLFPFILLCFMHTHTHSRAGRTRRIHTHTPTITYAICACLALQSLAYIYLRMCVLHLNCYVSALCEWVWVRDPFTATPQPFLLRATVLTRWLCLHIIHALLCPMAIWNLLSPPQQLSSSAASTSAFRTSRDISPSAVQPWRIAHRGELELGWKSESYREQDIDFNPSRKLPASTKAGKLPPAAREHIFN